MNLKKYAKKIIFGDNNQAPKSNSSLIPTDNPHLNKISQSDMDDYILRIINEYRHAENFKIIKLLDIGGGKGWGKILYEKKYIDYHCLDLKTSRTEGKVNYVKGDITDVNLNLNHSFDIIFTKDTFEHILNPWDSTKNILNHLKNGGLFIFIAPFTWRYHPSPYDAYRYTHTGAQYMFERLGGMSKVEAGYITYGDINGFWTNRKDWTLDSQAFPKCVGAIYVGRKQEGLEFQPSNLDSDFDWEHEN